MFTYIWGIFINHIIIYFALLIVTAYFYIREDAIEYRKENKETEKKEKERKAKGQVEDATRCLSLLPSSSYWIVFNHHYELDPENILKSLWTGLFWPLSLPYLILYKVVGNWMPKFIEVVVKMFNWWFGLKKKENKDTNGNKI